MTNKMKVLLVDDRKENLFVLETILKDEDIIMDKATSGNEALSMMLDKDYGLVLMDVQMPELDGFETAELMKGMNKTKNIPIIFVTAISKEERYMFKGYTVGAIDYIYKPIEPIILQSKIRVFSELYNQKHKYRVQAIELNTKVKELEIAKKQLLELNSKLMQISSIDGLTKVANRRAFDETLQIEWRRACRESKELSLLLLDIDFFKQYNDTYGHLAGDKCLVKVASALNDLVLRPGDFVARYGGEEFAIILPDTDEKGAEEVARKIKNGIEDLQIDHLASEVSPYVTVSVGVVTKTGNQATESELLECVDVALYKAKDKGRNNIISYCCG